MRLLGLCQNARHVCFRYRLQAFRPFLEAAGHEVRFRAWPRWFLFDAGFFEELRAADVVVVQRRLLSAWQLRRVRQAARTLVFDFDDAVFRRDSYAPRGAQSDRRLRGFARMVQAADLVVAGNAYLAEQARRWTGAERVRVVPTCVNVGAYALAQHTNQAVPPRSSRLVWIGSTSTLRGLEWIRDWLEQLGQDIPDLSLKIICDRTLELKRLPVQFQPWSSATEIQELAEADIGMSWLPPDSWSRGKCGLKILQYMAAGLPVVANPVGIQTKLVRHGLTGFLAETYEEWRTAIGELARQPELRQAMGAAGRGLVEEDYHVTRGAAAWLDLLKTLRPSARAALPLA